jgi:hypothetical protein
MYAVVGIFLLGVFIQSTGGNWLAWLESYPIGTPVLDWARGQFSIFTGSPLGPWLFTLYYFSHKRWQRRKLQKDNETMKKVDKFVKF